MVGAGDRAGDIGSDSAEEAITEKEYEGRGAVDHALRYQASAAAEAVQPIVPCTGLAPDRQQASARGAVSAAQPDGRALRDNAHQRLTHGTCRLGREDPLRLGLE